MARAKKTKFVYRPTSLADHVRRVVDYQLEEIQAFLQHVREYHRIRERRIEQLATTMCDVGDRFVDDNAELQQTQQLASQFAVIALHRVVERRRSWLLQYGVPTSAGKDLHRIDVAVKYATKNRGLDLATLAGARDVDEVRCLNNAIKHNGVVTHQLAKFPGWTLGAELGDVTVSYERVRTSVREYVVDLAVRTEKGAGAAQPRRRQRPALKPSTR